MINVLLKKYYPFIIIFILVFINLGTILYYQKDLNSTNTLENIDNGEEEETLTIQVDIKGEVKKPGLYQITKGSNINDLITLAGGLTKNGTTKNINLSRKLKDESVILIYSKSELKKKESTNIVYMPCTCSTVDISSCTETKSSVIETTKSDKSEGESSTINVEKETNSSKVSINKGTKEELMTLSGIGESKANAIIEYRSKNGNFEDIKDIIKVSGISETIYEKIKENIEL